MKKRPDGYYGYERRRKWLRGGRIDISLGTKILAEAKRLDRALDLLMEREDAELVEAIRMGALSVADAAAAVREDRLERVRTDLRRRSAGLVSSAARPDLSIGAAVQRVCETKVATQEQGTADAYARHGRTAVAFFGERRELHSITSDECRSLLYGPKPSAGGKPWEPNTQASAHMVFGVIWRSAIRMEAEAAKMAGVEPRLTDNPWEHVQPAQRRQTRNSFLEPEEFRVLVERALGRPSALTSALGCLAGLRAEEALHLRLGVDVDLTCSPGLLRIQPRGGEHAWKPKGDHSIRNVPVRPDLAELIALHVDAGFSGDRYLIRSSRADRPMSYSVLRLATMEAFGAAGLKYGREGEALTFHSLRHTFASWLARKGVASRDIARLMGNTAKEVDRTYAHLFPSDDYRVLMQVESPWRSGEISGIGGVDGGNLSIGEQ